MESATLESVKLHKNRPLRRRKQLATYVSFTLVCFTQYASSFHYIFIFLRTFNTTTYCVKRTSVNAAYVLPTYLKVHQLL